MSTDPIFHRTSIRQYTNQMVEDDKIAKILRAAMAAPSAANQQPWEFYVIKDKKKLKKLAKCSPYAGCVANAQVAFVPCFRKSCDLPEYAQIDLSAAVENMLLEVDSLGLGAVWLGIAPLQERMDAVGQVLDLPENLECFAIVPCGYPVKVNTQQDRYDEARLHFL